VTFVRLPSAQIRIFSGRSRAASGAASMTGVQATGSPNITSVVSRSRSPASRACSLWSTIAKIFMPRAAKIPVSRETVEATGRGLSLVMT
jgi:hypothetical protein